MVATQHPLPNVKRTPEERLGVSDPPPTCRQDRQVLKRLRKAGIITFIKFTDRQRAVQRRLRLVEPSHALVDMAEGGQTLGDQRRVRAESLFSDGDGAFEQRFGRRIAPLPPVYVAQTVGGLGDVRVL